MRLPAWILAALCLSPAAHAEDDWLAGEYEVGVPDHPEAMRFVLVVKRAADGRYRQEIFKESGDAATGRALTRVEPWQRPPGAEPKLPATAAQGSP